MGIFVKAPRERLLILFFHPFGRAATWLSRAAKGGIITAHFATVLKFDDVAFGVPSDGKLGVAAITRMRADNFGRLAVLIQQLATLYPLLHAGHPYGFAFGAHHRQTVVSFEGIDVLLCLNSVEHQHMLAALHRFHGLGFIGGASGCRQPNRECHCDCGAYTKDIFVFCGLHIITYCFFCLFSIRFNQTESVFDNILFIYLLPDSLDDSAALRLFVLVFRARGIALPLLSIFRGSDDLAYPPILRTPDSTVSPRIILQLQVDHAFRG